MIPDHEAKRLGELEVDNSLYLSPAPNWQVGWPLLI
jgi:hypothetical protein